MNPKFLVGQKVRIIKSGFPELIGEITFIKFPYGEYKLKLPSGEIKQVSGYYGLDIQPGTSKLYLYAPENNLELVEDYDGDIASTWEACEWQPLQIKRKKPTK